MPTLEQIYADIEKIAADRLAINERESELRKAAVEEVRKVVKALNITQEELFAERARPASRAPAAKRCPTTATRKTRLKPAASWAASPPGTTKRSSAA